MLTAAPPSHDDTKVERLDDLPTFGVSSQAARRRRRQSCCRDRPSVGRRRLGPFLPDFQGVIETDDGAEVLFDYEEATAGPTQSVGGR
jgi:hypothetical protein